MSVPIHVHNRSVFRVAAAGLMTGFICGGIAGALIVGVLLAA